MPLGLDPYRTAPSSLDDPPAEKPAPHDGDCPACRGMMRAVVVEQVEVRACASCGGHYVTHDAMTALADARSHQGRKSPRGGGYAAPSVSRDRVVLCPMCASGMKVVYFCHGCSVLVDVCVPHGTWFDRLELDIALDSIEGGATYRRPDRTSSSRPPPPPSEPYIPPPPRRPFHDIALLSRALEEAAQRHAFDEVVAIIETLRQLVAPV